VVAGSNDTYPPAGCLRAWPRGSAYACTHNRSSAQLRRQRGPKRHWWRRLAKPACPVAGRQARVGSLRSTGRPDSLSAWPFSGTPNSRGSSG